MKDRTDCLLNAFHWFVRTCKGQGKQNTLYLSHSSPGFHSTRPVSTVPTGCVLLTAGNDICPQAPHSQHSLQVGSSQDGLDAHRQFFSAAIKPIQTCTLWHRIVLSHHVPCQMYAVQSEASYTASHHVLMFAHPSLDSERGDDLSTAHLQASMVPPQPEPQRLLGPAKYKHSTPFDSVQCLLYECLNQFA